MFSTFDRGLKWTHFILSVEMEETTPETVDKISDANEEIVKKKPGRPRFLGTSPNILSHWRTSLYQFLTVLRKYWVLR